MPAQLAQLVVLLPFKCCVANNSIPTWGKNFKKHAAETSTVRCFNAKHDTMSCSVMNWNPILSSILKLSSIYNLTLTRLSML